MEQEIKTLNKNKIYLIQKQQEYDFKVRNLRNLNENLVIRYNDLFDKGKNIYNAFFELFYQVLINFRLKWKILQE